ncbi:MAG: NAD(P)-dependent alcohol dehydrogenase [Clostridiales bacterium]|nr:NAD(P)-dependent alcohol dehydrogenase [Clostridiales bacterium]
MKVSYMTGIGGIAFESRPIPVPEAGEVLVRIEWVGVCGSDLHYYEAGRIGGFVVEPPFVLGHEAGGVVAALGAGVESLAVGDRVALEPGITCGVCEFCKSGRYNLCPDVRFFATPPIGGVFQEYAAHPAALCFKLPDNVSTMEGALIEPLAVGFHAAKTGSAGPGQTAFVFGAGCIGLVSILALKASGVDRVFAADFLENRLAMAEKVGAAGVINPGKANIIDEAMKAAPGGYDLIIETSGNEKAAAQAISLCKKGGTIVLVGYSPSGNMTLPIGIAIDKELTLKTIFRYRDVYPSAIQAVADGRINIKDIVTDIFDFDELPEAMRRCAAEKSAIVKAVIRID